MNLDKDQMLKEEFQCQWCGSFYDMCELGGKDQDSHRDVCVYCVENGK